MRIAILVIVALYFINYCQSQVAVVDAGSSGTRLYIFQEKGTGTCPVRKEKRSLVGNCPKSSVFTSKLGPLRMDNGDPAKYLAVLLNFMNHYDVGKMAGGATAGVRNNDFIRQKDVREYLHNADLAFLPGTDEAFYEWLAVNFDGCNGDLGGAAKLTGDNFRNFISAGGASAQAAFTIPKSDAFGDKFIEFMSTLDNEMDAKYKGAHDPRCNAGYNFLRGKEGNIITYFVKIAILHKDRFFKEIPADTVSLNNGVNFFNECIDKKKVNQRCVVFFSFLAGASDDAEKKCIPEGAYDTLAALSPTVEGHFFHNLVGGAKETYFNFLLTYLGGVERIAGGGGDSASRFEAGKTFWTQDTEGNTLPEKDQGMFAATGLTSDHVTVKKALAVWMQKDHFFKSVSSFISDNLNAIPGEWYGVGSFAKKHRFDKAKFDKNAPFAWGNIFMQAMMENYGLDESTLHYGNDLGLTNEGDWSFGLALVALDGKCPEKCDIAVPDWSIHDKVFDRLDKNGCTIYITDFTLVPNDLLLLEQAVMSLL